MVLLNQLNNLASVINEQHKPLLANPKYKPYNEAIF
jgi:hypothetical protein